MRFTKLTIKMKTLLIITACLLTQIASADTINITLRDGKTTYPNAEIIDVAKTGITIRTQAGATVVIPVAKLPDDLKKECKTPHHGAASVGGL